MLSGTLPLHDIADAERFAASVLQTHLVSHPATIRPEDREDALAYLIETLWELSLTYEPSGAASFSKYAHGRIGLRLIDWIRARYGRTKWRWSDGSSYERPRVDVLSLDARSAVDDFSLGELVAGSGGDHAADGDSDLLLWLHEGGDRQAAFDTALVRDLAAREAARRAPRDERAEQAREDARLRVLRVRRVADACGVTPQTSRLWLAGRTRPGSPESREKFERVLAELELEPAPPSVGPRSVRRPRRGQSPEPYRS